MQASVVAARITAIAPGAAGSRRSQRTDLAGRRRPASAAADRPLQCFAPRPTGIRTTAIANVSRRGRPGHVRHRTRRRPATEEPLTHDQANLARPRIGHVPRGRGRRMQQQHHAGPDGVGPIDRPGVGADVLDGSRQRPPPVAERLLALASRSRRPGSRRTWGVVLCRPRRARGRPMGDLADSRWSPLRCNARAIREPVSGLRVQGRRADAASGSGVVGRRSFNRRGDRGPWSISVPRARPSGNAALGETTTSTAPHLSVRGLLVGVQQADPADRRMQRG
jgi:hypothetical protein